MLLARTLMTKMLTTVSSRCSFFCFFYKEKLQIVCSLLLWTLTLVFGVTVSILMNQLAVGARPVTRCLLAGQEGQKWMKEWNAKKGTK